MGSQKTSASACCAWLSWVAATTSTCHQAFPRRLCMQNQANPTAKCPPSGPASSTTCETNSKHSTPGSMANCPLIVIVVGPIKWLWKHPVCSSPRFSTPVGQTEGVTRSGNVCQIPLSCPSKPGQADLHTCKPSNVLTHLLTRVLNSKKAPSRFAARIGDAIIGGQSPTFDDIGGHHRTNSPDEDRIPALVDADRAKLRRFTSVSFEDDADNHWHPKVRELLAMTLLLRCEQFCDVLRHPNHPDAHVPEAPESHNPCMM